MLGCHQGANVIVLGFDAIPETLTPLAAPETTGSIWSVLHCLFAALFSHGVTTFGDCRIALPTCLKPFFLFSFIYFTFTS